MNESQENSLPAKDDWLQGVEGEAAQRLVSSNSPVIRVVAGPGAGKTYGLKRRVQRRLAEGVPADRIFVGTFTRAIARALVRDLATEEVMKLEIRTLHGLASRLLSEYSKARKGREMRFLLEHEQDCMLCDISEEVAGSLKERQTRLRALEAGWSRGDVLADAAFRGVVERWMYAHGAMMVGEVIPLAVEGIESGDIPEGLFDEVIVDEFQDLTLAEQNLIEKIWSGNRSLVVLGDDDQSIYSFRFAHPGGITSWHERFSPETFEDVTIPENRRSLPEIVTMANEMIQRLGPTKQPMVPVRGGAAHLAKIHWDDTEAEIEGIAHAVASIATAGRTVHILVPKRFLGHRLKQRLGELGIGASTSFHQEILETTAVRKGFSLLSALVDPGNPIAIRAWLGLHPTSETTPTHRNSSAYRSLAGDGTLDEGHVRALASGEVDARGEGSSLIQIQAENLVEAWEETNGLETREIVAYCLPDSRADIHENERRRRQAVQDLQILRDALSRLLDENENDLRKSITELRYRIATGMPLVDTDEEPLVEIMTLHGAKGLEAEAIFLVGMADEMFRRDEETGQMDPEAGRLVYVAVTRARDILVISRAKEMDFADARQNWVRQDPDSVRNRDGEKVLLLSHPQFIPSEGTRAGNDWLEAWFSDPPTFSQPPGG